MKKKTAIGSMILILTFLSSCENVNVTTGDINGDANVNTEPKEQTTKVLPKCSPAKFRAGLKQIQAGEITKEAILKQVSLTAEQQKELDAI